MSEAGAAIAEAKPPSTTPDGHNPPRFRQFCAYVFDLVTRLMISLPALLLHGRMAVLTLAASHLWFIGYRILAHHVYGATIGKAIFGVRVVSLTGESPPGTSKG